jgi:hypothetical protein
VQPAQVRCSRILGDQSLEKVSDGVGGGLVRLNTAVVGLNTVSDRV